MGLPERNLRMASFALAGAVGGLAGFAGGELLLAFFANGATLNFLGFVPVALGGLGNNRGAVIGGLALGVFQQAANFLMGGVVAGGRRLRRVHHRPAGRARKACSAPPPPGGFEAALRRRSHAPTS